MILRFDRSQVPSFLLIAFLALLLPPPLLGVQPQNSGGLPVNSETNNEANVRMKALIAKWSTARTMISSVHAEGVSFEGFIPAGSKFRRADLDELVFKLIPSHVEGSDDPAASALATVTSPYFLSRKGQGTEAFGGWFDFKLFASPTESRYERSWGGKEFTVVKSQGKELRYNPRNKQVDVIHGDTGENMIGIDDLVLIPRQLLSQHEAVTKLEWIASPVDDRGFVRFTATATKDLQVTLSVREADAFVEHYRVGFVDGAALVERVQFLPMNMDGGVVYPRVSCSYLDVDTAEYAAGPVTAVILLRVIRLLDRQPEFASDTFKMNAPAGTVVVKYEDGIPRSKPKRLPAERVRVDVPDVTSVTSQASFGSIPKSRSKKEVPETPQRSYRLLITTLFSLSLFALTFAALRFSRRVDAKH